MRKGEGRKEDEDENADDDEEYDDDDVYDACKLRLYGHCVDKMPLEMRKGEGRKGKLFQEWFRGIVSKLGITLPALPTIPGLHAMLSKTITIGTPTKVTTTTAKPTTVPASTTAPALKIDFTLNKSI